MSSDNVVIIGASTGGPAALKRTFRSMPRLNASVILVQHMPEFINASFRKSLEKISAMQVLMASNGSRLKAGSVYVAPSEFHLELAAGGTIRIGQGPKVCFVRPSVNVAMKSMSPAKFRRLVGVVMTGMGCDGADGVAHLKRLGGTIIVQSEKTCAVYGMPKAAVGTGAVDCAISPEGIGEKLASLVGVM